ncbi:hypothetical protein [Streptomyces sp. NPDC051554]|uniref:hypothetical protein n=1 Tax=Streptomyces sp. NPDC051554 TaxID=3365656 RepID=UPI0037A99984
MKDHADWRKQHDYRRKLIKELRQIPDLTDEDGRLLLRILDPWVFEEWTESRGLKGLRRTSGGVEQWEFGWKITCRLKGRLDFYAVEAQGPAIVTALGLKRGMQTMPDETDLTTQQIAECMVAAHRKRRGSVLMVLPGDRSDRAVLWLGMSDQLAQAAAGQDNMRALHEAAERERKEEREAQRSASGPNREDLARSLAFQRQFAEQWAQQNAAGKDAARPSPAPGGRPRISVCDDVRDLVSQAPGGLTAAEITTKSGYSQSRVYACLNGHLDSGVITKVGKRYVTTPKIEEDPS